MGGAAAARLTGPPGSGRPRQSHRGARALLKNRQAMLESRPKGIAQLAGLRPVITRWSGQCKNLTKIREASQNDPCKGVSSVRLFVILGGHRGTCKPCGQNVRLQWRHGPGYRENSAWHRGRKREPGHARAREAARGAAAGVPKAIGEPQSCTGWRAGRWVKRGLIFKRPGWVIRFRRLFYFKRYLPPERAAALWITRRLAARQRKPVLHGRGTRWLQRNGAGAHG